jgi:hypothetical protein
VDFYFSPKKLFLQHWSFSFMTFSVSKCSCQCACHPGNKKTAQAGNCKPGAGGRKKKRKFGGSVSDAVKAPEATLDFGKEP